MIFSFISKGHNSRTHKRCVKIRLLLFNKSLFFHTTLTHKPSSPLDYHHHHLSTDQPLMPSDPLKGSVRKGCQGSVTGPIPLYMYF